MIIEITALVASIVALVAQILTVREQNRKWDEYNKNSKKTISESNIVIENKIKGSIVLKPKEQ
jgi:Cys-tRNA synthase (O-phospho-L-seryl-tRNA:Cys-tRNA synthase)